MTKNLMNSDDARIEDKLKLLDVHHSIKDISSTPDYHHPSHCCTLIATIFLQIPHPTKHPIRVTFHGAIVHTLLC